MPVIDGTPIRVRVTVPRLAFRERLRSRPAALAAGALVLAALAVAGTGVDHVPLAAAARAGDPAPGPAEEVERRVAELGADTRKLESQVAGRAPKRAYIVVDRANNRLYLRDRSGIRLEAACSCGSGALLRDPSADRKWVFETPQGAFRVLSTTRNPVWKKPDWAFVEEGEPVPRDPRERIENGVLGEYALHLGDGYMIHGTLYERLLGRSVTHGCIRLGRDDLRKVYAAAGAGTPVYVF